MGKKKRGPKDVFKDGKTHVFQVDTTAKQVSSLSADTLGIADMLTLVLLYFCGMCITTNLCEGRFSMLTSIFRFKGNRSAASWDIILEVWFYQAFSQEFVAEFYHRRKIRTTLGVRNGLPQINFANLPLPLDQCGATLAVN